MKLAVILAIVLASPALAQDGTLRLAWDACPGAPGAVGGVVFDCDPQSGSLYRLESSFTLHEALAGVQGVDGTVEFVMRDARTVPPFWHFEAGSCNATGFEFRAARPAAGCSGVSDALCGSGGASCAIATSYLAGSAAGLPAHHARLYLSLQRPAANPAALASGPALFGFELRFAMDHAISAVCGGCTEVVAITWLELTLLDASGQPVAHVAHTDSGSDATVYANCLGCTIVPARGPSWGLLKALYR